MPNLAVKSHAPIGPNAKYSKINQSGAGEHYQHHRFWRNSAEKYALAGSLVLFHCLTRFQPQRVQQVKQNASQSVQQREYWRQDGDHHS